MTVDLARKNKAKQTQFYLAPSTAGGFKTKLKKQSQFAEGQNDVKPVLTMTYGIFYDWRRRKNKANQSQFVRSQRHKT